MSESFGERIRRLRHQSGLTQVQLADKTGVSSGQIISTWEHGQCWPHLTVVSRLAAVLGVSCDVLLTGQDGKR